MVGVEVGSGGGSVEEAVGVEVGVTVAVVLACCCGVAKGGADLAGVGPAVGSDAVQPTKTSTQAITIDN